MDRKAFAVYTLLIGAGMGLLGNILFYGKLVGLSFPLFVGISTMVVLVSCKITGQSIQFRNLWTLVPMMFFASMVAVHTSELITALNIAATLSLGALALYYLPLKRYLDEDNLAEHGFGVFEASVSVMFSPLAEIGDSAAWLRERRPDNRGSLVAVGRGMLMAVPVLVVFAVLLASADAVFAEYLDRMWRILELNAPQDAFFQAFFIGAVGWVACGALAYGLGRRNLPQAEATEEQAPAEPKRKSKPMTLGLIETGIVLGSLDVLFALFVLIQFAYFFGGQANVRVGALTYAEYARRGFFELVAVSILTLGLVLWLDWVTVRHDARQIRVFRILAVILVALTGVMLVSASQRMLLYEAAYGFTHLRVYTHVFMFWMGALFVIFLLSVFRLRERVFSLGVLVVVIGYLGTLNVMNVEQYIADHNVERFESGAELDTAYLYTFSADAAPAMLRLFENADENSPEQQAAAQWLANLQVELDRLRQNATIFSANLARDRAWAALNALRTELPVADPYYRPSGSSLSGYSR
jgi:hypothetical protein